MNRRQRITDELLVLRCQEGCSHAFGDLAERWQERLWRHAWRLTGEESAAWDALQEAWLVIARDITRLEDAAAFPVWAYQIVSNKCRDWIRRECRRRRTIEDYADRLRHAENSAGDPPADFGSLKEALQQLSGPDRAILTLRYDEGFATAEIAAVLEVPVGTVRSRLHYAKKRLKHYLEDLSDE
jgi:RNA polymerase sigma factor (sigma-70 family)